MRRLLASILWTAGQRVVGFGLLLYWLADRVNPGHTQEVLDGWVSSDLGDMS